MIYEFPVNKNSLQLARDAVDAGKTIVQRIDVSSKVNQKMDESAERWTKGISTRDFD